MSNTELETSKIEVRCTEHKIIISDRMQINRKEILILLAITSLVAMLITGILAGFLYAVIFNTGYLLFRYFAWMFWKQIKIDLEKQSIEIAYMIFERENKREVVSTQFKRKDLLLNEFEQSGKPKAIIQYRTHSTKDLMVITSAKDILLLKEKVFVKSTS